MIMMLTVAGATGQIWYFGIDFGFISGVHRIGKDDQCVAHDPHPVWLLAPWRGKGQLVSCGFKGVNDICEVNLSTEITAGSVVPDIISCPSVTCSCVISHVLNLSYHLFIHVSCHPLHSLYFFLSFLPVTLCYSSSLSVVSPILFLKGLAAARILSA